MASYYHFYFKDGSELGTIAESMREALEIAHSEPAYRFGIDRMDIHKEKRVGMRGVNKKRRLNDVA